MTAGAKGGGKGRGGRPKGGLAPEEQALWEHAAQSMAPAKKLKARVLLRPGEDLIESNPRPAKKPERGATGGSEAGPPRVAAANTDPAPSPRTRVATTSAPPLADFDRKAARRLRSGQIEITSRIDLHGMRQDEAHDALRRFLHACQRRGERWVLVITGKGGPRRGHDDDDDGVHRPAPGVLKRNVPRWLAEPDLRTIVVSTTEAAIHHGGGGALYVQLRKLK